MYGLYVYILYTESIESIVGRGVEMTHSFIKREDMDDGVPRLLKIRQVCYDGKILECDSIQLQVPGV